MIGFAGVFGWGHCFCQSAFELEAFYPVNGSEISWEFEQQLDSAIKSLPLLPETYRVTVTGYSDRIGSTPSRRKLSKARAEKLANVLAQAGFDADRIETVGAGVPQGINDTSSARMRKATLEFGFELPEQTVPVLEPKPFQHFTVGGQIGDVLRTEEGSVLAISGEAFQDEKGNPVKGDIEIRYREFRTNRELLDAEINLTDLKQRKGYRSAGTFDLQAFQNGRPVYLKPNSNIGLIFQAHPHVPNLSLYRQDESKTTWEHLYQITNQQGTVTTNEQNIFPCGTPTAPSCFYDPNPCMQDFYIAKLGVEYAASTKPVKQLMSGRSETGNAILAPIEKALEETRNRSHVLFSRYNQSVQTWKSVDSLEYRVSRVKTGGRKIEFRISSSTAKQYNDVEPFSSVVFRGTAQNLPANFFKKTYRYCRIRVKDNNRGNLRLGDGDAQVRFKTVKLRQEDRQGQSPYSAYKAYRTLEKERQSAAEVLKLKADSLYAAYQQINDSIIALEHDLENYLSRFQDQRLGSFECLWKWSTQIGPAGGQGKPFEEWITYFEENRATYLRYYQSIFNNAPQFVRACREIQERLDRERFLLETSRWKRAREMRTDTLGLSLNLSRLGRYTVAQEYSYIQFSLRKPGHPAVLQIDRYVENEKPITINRVMLFFGDRLGIYTTEGMPRFGPYKLPAPFSRVTILAQDESGNWHYTSLFEKGEQQKLVVELKKLQELDEVPGLRSLLERK